MVVAVYRTVGRVLSQTGPYAYGVADEGGYGPPLPCHEDALGLLYDATRLAGYRCARDGDIAIGIDVAATEFVADDGRYLLRAEGRSFTAAGLADLLAHWCITYPIISVEDGLAEDDWAGWEYLTGKLGQSTQLIGDDLFTTNPQRLARGADAGIANAVLVKPNQIGTLTETWKPCGWRRNGATGQSSRPVPAKRRIRPLPTWRWPRAPDKSKSGPSPAPNGWPSTTGCCALRRSWGNARSSPGGTYSPGF